MSGRAVFLILTISLSVACGLDLFRSDGYLAKRNEIIMSSNPTAADLISTKNLMKRDTIGDIVTGTSTPTNVDNQVVNSISSSQLVKRCNYEKETQESPSCSSSGSSSGSSCGSSSGSSCGSSSGSLSGSSSGSSFSETDEIAKNNSGKKCQCSDSKTNVEARDVEKKEKKGKKKSSSCSSSSDTDNMAKKNSDKKCKCSESKTKGKKRDEDGKKCECSDSKSKKENGDSKKKGKKEKNGKKEKKGNKKSSSCSSSSETYEKDKKCKCSDSKTKSGSSSTCNYGDETKMNTASCSEYENQEENNFGCSC